MIMRKRVRVLRDKERQTDRENDWRETRQETKTRDRQKNEMLELKGKRWIREQEREEKLGKDEKNNGEKISLKIGWKGKETGN